MLNARTTGLAEPKKTWVLVAHRSGARIYEANGSLARAVPVRIIDHPEGRLRDRDLHSDRDGATIAEGKADYPVHGMVNKGKATEHVMEQFARQLRDLLYKGRADRAFGKLILVAEPKLLGELRNNLDAPTLSLVAHTLEKDWSQLDDAAVKSRLADLQPPR